MRATPTTWDELKKKKITLADYLLMPELHHPYEIIDGEMMPSPAPTLAHQIIGANVFSPLSQYVKTKESGVVLFAPVDIILQRDPLGTRQPDVLFIHRDNLPGISLDDLEELQLLEITPDLVIEVLSPSENWQIINGLVSKNVGWSVGKRTQLRYCAYQWRNLNERGSMDSVRPSVVKHL